MIMHLILLFAAQWLIHYDPIPSLRKITFYEGVEKLTYSQILETIKNPGR
ncbi:YpfB family protein [Rossellomorea marisflavi]|nr:YpfB family protein [Rossellomorea marisflavi]